MTTISDHELAELGGVQRMVAEHRDAVHELLRGIPQPASIETIALSPNRRGQERSQPSRTSKSFGLINPNPFTVWVGLAGGGATLEARGFGIPANSAMVLPVTLDDADIGTDVANLGSSEAIVWLLRFDHVQPFYFGGLAPQFGAQGTFGYAAGTAAATVDVPAAARVKRVAVYASGAGAATITIAGGATITVPASSAFDTQLSGSAPLGADVVIAGNVQSYYVEWA